MSQHDKGGHQGGPGLEVALVGVLVAGLLLREGAAPLADAMGHELASGVPFVDLPFRFVAWVWDAVVGDLTRDLLGEGDDS
ncbi:MAG: hypothetical protein M3R38_16375 [Actinomycetota bacterium]|nr:hypothetical protein [Actinomycetota bacterium]